MIDNPHFVAVASPEAAEDILVFSPRLPRRTAGFHLEALQVHVRDHKRRELPVADRTFEAHYGGFVVTQASKGEDEARRWALSLSYGRAGRPALVHGHEARMYELGPEVPPDDIDGRRPAVVTWHDGDMFYLIASGELSVSALIDIAGSIYG